MTTVATVTCAQSGCKVATDGKCIDGFELANCPNYGKESEPKEIIAPVPDLSGRLRAGFSVADAAAHVARHDTQVIMLGGYIGSGKTTILTTLYDAFLDGTFGDFQFAGSRTLPGYEMRGYLNRGGFGDAKPDTERTKLSTPEPFVHLEIARRNAPTHRHDLLFFDGSGEAFREAQNSSSAVHHIPGIRRADCLSILLDGKQLLSAELRHEAIVNARQMIRAFLDSGAIGIQTRVQLIVTKKDLWDENVQAAAFIREKVTQLQQTFSTRVGAITVFEVAARPEKPGKFQLGHGIPELIQEWIAPAEGARETQPSPLDALRRYAEGAR